MDTEVYKMVNEFLKKYPLTMAFRLSQHAKIIDKHLNPGEKIVYAFPAQKNPSSFDIITTCIIAFTNKRILVARKNILPGYSLNSITPDMFNDFQVYRGFIFGRVDIDTVREVVQLSNISPKALPEIETNLSEYLIKEKPKFIQNQNKERKENSNC